MSRTSRKLVDSHLLKGFFDKAQEYFKDSCWLECYPNSGEFLIVSILLEMEDSYER
jgi:hypothetical protein